MLCTTATNTSNTIRTQTAAFGEGWVCEEANVGVCQSAAAAVVVGGVFRGV